MKKMNHPFCPFVVNQGLFFTFALAMLLRGSYSSADGLVGNRLPGTTSFCAAPKQPPELHSAGVVGSGWPRAARGSGRS